MRANLGRRPLLQLPPAFSLWDQTNRRPYYETSCSAANHGARTGSSARLSARHDSGLEAGRLDSGHGHVLVLFRGSAADAHGTDHLVVLVEY